MSTKKETEQVLRNIERRRRDAAKKRRRTKRILITVGVVLGVILILLGMAYGIFRHYYNLMNYEATAPEILDTIPHDDDYDPDATNSDNKLIDDAQNNIEDNVGKNKVVFHEGVYNLLLIGTDSRDPNYDRGRSDSMIVFSVNTEKKTITMTSLMRDTYLHIPDKGNNRINAAYSYGGAPLLIQTIEENFGIHIDNYVVANFTVFKDIVDTIGGVDIEISSAEIDVMNMYIGDYNEEMGGEPRENDQMSYSQAGYTHLNGKQAMAYCRVRYVGNGDFDRTARQREVIDAIIGKCKSMSVSELNKLAETVLPWLSTDLAANKALELAYDAITQGYYKYDLQSLRIPADDTWSGVMIDGMSVLSIDFDDNRDLFFETVYGKSYEDLIS